VSKSLNELTATELLDKLQRTECSVGEIALAHLQQTKQWESYIEAWAHLDPEQVTRSSEALDNKKRKGQSIGKLFGIPVGVKDIFNTKHMPTQMGSPIWKDFQAGNDARVVHYLQMDDAYVMGKTVTAEFAVHAPGPTRNPHNLKHTPGTSSSGSAAAVAARMVPMALGTQTAGSIIRPSSYCGVFGFKPSFGLIPRTGVLKTTDSLDTIGGIARCVSDLELLFNCIRVKGRDFPVSENALNDSNRQVKPKNRKWRIALVKGPKWQNSEIYARQSLHEYATKLASSGLVEIEEVELPAEFAQAHEIHSTIYDRTLAYYFHREFEKHTLVSPNIYDIITRGNTITLDQYKEALLKQDQLYAIMDQLMSSKCDILLGLSTGGEALANLDSVDRPDNCLIWTLCGNPAINLPVFKGPLGLPFGAQAVARRYNDYLLLQFAKEMETCGLAGQSELPQLPQETMPTTSSENRVNAPGV